MEIGLYLDGSDAGPSLYNGVTHAIFQDPGKILSDATVHYV